MSGLKNLIIGIRVNNEYFFEFNGSFSAIYKRLKEYEIICRILSIMIKKCNRTRIREDNSNTLIY